MPRVKFEQKGQKHNNTPGFIARKHGEAPVVTENTEVYQQEFNFPNQGKSIKVNSLLGIHEDGNSRNPRSKDQLSK